jgi:hypothetical protein
MKEDNLAENINNQMGWCVPMETLQATKVCANEATLPRLPPHEKKGSEFGQVNVVLTMQPVEDLVFTHTKAQSVESLQQTTHPYTEPCSLDRWRKNFTT